MGIEKSLRAVAKSAQQPASASNAAKDEQDVRVLEPAKPIERELAGGQSHAYQIILAEGQFLNVIVEQRGIDVVVRLSGPDGKQIAEFDSEIWKQGRETVTQAAEMTGSYRLNVQAKETRASAGRYEIRVAELRAATGRDRVLQEARKSHTESLRLYSAGKYDEAYPLAERALRIREKELGPEHPEVAQSLHNLAIIDKAKGDYTTAEPLFERALTIWEKALGPEHPNLAVALGNLTLLYREKGDYARAEPLAHKALAIREKALGREHPDVAGSLNNLAILYNDKGDYAKAEPLYQRALAIREKALGPEHPDVAQSLNNLATLYCDEGDCTKAEPLFERALAIWEKALGPDHPNLAVAVGNLALVYRGNGDYARAESLYQRALGIKERAYGPSHPSVAFTLNNIATLYRDKGEYAKAEPLYQRVLAIREKVIGSEHPDIANSLNDLARLYEAKGDIAQAVAFQSRASAISERNIALNTATGSERQKLAYLATLSAEYDQIISLQAHAAPNDVAARDLAISTVLLRKGRVLDVMTDSIATLRRRASPPDQALLDQVKDARSQLASLVLSGPQRTTPAEHQSQIRSRAEQVEQLEAEISRHSDEFRIQSQRITMAAIQSVIPDDAALIEFTLYRPFNAKYSKPVEQFGKPRYVVYILLPRGEARWVDLGEAAVINRAVEAWRKALRDPNQADVKQLARALDERVMSPVRKLLGETRNLLLSPEGALNLLPFGALVDENKRYLIESYSLTYLTSGRDLLRLQTHTPSKQGPLVVANPQFDVKENTIASNQTDNQNAEARRSADFARISFDPLPSTAVEARALATLLPGAKVLTGAEATETMIKQVRGPSILHVATHGFFLPDQRPGASDRSPGPEERKDLFSEDPLLRSGLVLAGANQRRSGAGEDGILTASEVAGLDLWGTKLVVLSACDTGLGEVKNGDGVYGLRRALVLAGAESQVMSLWEVADKATRELMVGYYTGLKHGEGRSEALRNVQLKMLKDRDRRHPFYWAGFIQSGEWANLEGKR